jgi:hypothetical protein
MKTNTRLKKIEKNSFELGNDAFATYLETKSLKALEGAIHSYACTMQAIRYQLLFNNLK